MYWNYCSFVTLIDKSLTIATRRRRWVGGMLTAWFFLVFWRRLKPNKAIASMHKCLYYGHKLHCVLYFTDTSTSSLWLCEEVILRLFFAIFFLIWMQIRKKLNKRRWMYENICSLLTQTLQIVNFSGICVVIVLYLNKKGTFNCGEWLRRWSTCVL